MTPRCPKCRELADVELTSGGMWHCARCRVAWEPRSPDPVPTSKPAPARAVRIVSFGFKHGIPVLRDGDRVIDVRKALNNPWAMPAVRAKSYPAPDVVALVESDPAFGRVVDDVAQIVRELAQGQGGTVYVGCTGGRHRSPVVAVAAARASGVVGVEVRHRESGDR